MQNSYFIGKEGFIWFVGVVEDRQDPEELGRVRVRCLGWHTDNLQDIPTESLPFAQVIHASNGGNAMYAPREGEWVVGFFMDGENAQHPVILGILPGKPTQSPDASKGFNDPLGWYPYRRNEPSTNRLSRGRKDGTITRRKEQQSKTGVKQIAGEWSEPASPYAPSYPFNHAYESEAGHVLEFDDTSGAERVHLAHTNGSYIEMHPDGTVAYRANKDRYSIVIGDEYVSVDGDCHVTVGGDCNMKVVGKFNMEAAEINLNSAGAVNIKAGGALKQEGATVDIVSGGVFKLGTGDTLHLKGGTVNIGGGTLNLSTNISNKVRCPHGMGKILPAGGPASPTNTGLKGVK